jgi:hypothetical protein
MDWVFDTIEFWLSSNKKTVKWALAFYVPTIMILCYLILKNANQNITETVFLSSFGAFAFSFFAALILPYAYMIVMLIITYPLRIILDKKRIDIPEVMGFIIEDIPCYIAICLVIISAIALSVLLILAITWVIMNYLKVVILVAIIAAAVVAVYAVIALAIIAAAKKR